MAADLGPVGLFVQSLHGVPAVVRAAGRCDPERYRLSLITEEAKTDVLVLHDGWPPFGSVMLHFPKAALPLRSPGLERLPACRLPADTGMGAVLARYLTSVASALEKGEVGEREGERLGEVALDLTVMTLTPWVRAHDEVTPESRRQVLLGKIEAFIEHRLGDPDLTPTAIAGRHHISPAYLHRLFQNRELTVAAWIRHRRLESCRADLADPALRRHPVHAIGARWGFRGAAEFSRAFRAAYGTTPGDYRRRVLERQ